MTVFETRLGTELAGQYLFKLCKHFSRKAQVVFDPEQGEVQFSCGIGRLYAAPSELRLTAIAASEADARQVCHILDQHLALLTRRQPVVLQWQLADNAINDNDNHYH